MTFVSELQRAPFFFSSGKPSWLWSFAVSKSFILLPLAPLALDYNLYIYHCGELSGKSNGWSFWILVVEFGSLRREKHGRLAGHLCKREARWLEYDHWYRYFRPDCWGQIAILPSHVRWHCKEGREYAIAETSLLTRVRLSSALGRLSRFYGFSSSWYTLSFNSVSRTEQFF